MVGNCSGERKICAGIEGWVYVDQVHFPREVRQERWQDIFLISPDEPVAPFRVTAASKKLEIAPAILRALVDRLDGLKRQRNSHRPLLLISFVLPIPNQFGHPYSLWGNLYNS